MKIISSKIAKHVDVLPALRLGHSAYRGGGQMPSRDPPCCGIS